MSLTSAAFSGGMAEFYERYMGSVFHPYAADMSDRLGGMATGSVLELAAGTGIVTDQLARRLPPAVAITATDLSQPMLDFAAGRPTLARVTMQQADATALPFPDSSFDAVICQFGVMFFPDRVRGHAEAWRVLRPGGRYIFSTWDSLAHNPDIAVVERAVKALFPDHPIGFFSRIPFGYHDAARIQEDLRAGGFPPARIATVSALWQPASAEEAAIGLCRGTPLRNEIEAADPDGVPAAMAAATAALTARFGDGPLAIPHRALVVEARK
jgi:SAM-dependent methyltransferase